MTEPLPRGFYILNIIRCSSVISLLMAIVAAGISLVKSFVVTKVRTPRSPLCQSIKLTKIVLLL